MDNTLYSNPAYTRHQEQVLVDRLAGAMGMSGIECQDMIDSWRSTHASENGGRNPSLGNTFLHFGIPMSTSIAWRAELIRPESFLSPDPVLAETLGTLSAYFLLAVVTNNPVSVAQRTFRCLGVDPGIFRVVVGLDTTGVSKPDPEPFRRALAAMGLPAAECVSVGDRFEIDLEPAMGLGCGGILVDGTHDFPLIPGPLLPLASPVG